MANYRNPDGYGGISKLSGRRRNPYVVRKTIGYDDRAYPIYQVIGYFPTRQDAMIALADFSNDPYDIDLSKITFKELFERWSKSEFQKFGHSLVSQHNASFNYCESLYNIPYKDIRKFQMQDCIDKCGKGYATQAIIKNLFVAMDNYAFDQDIIKKRYSSTLTVAKKETQSEHVPFTDSEVQLLWKHLGEPFVDETLFQLYTGCRMSEMLGMKCKDIDLEQGIMRGGCKTEAGKNRVIPIHPKISSLVKSHCGQQELLFNRPVSESAEHPETALRTSYSTAWKRKMTALGINHRTHDCRHTFRSKLDSANANKVCIDLIMGHKTSDVGERVYTHKKIEELKSAIELLDYGI